MAAPVLEQGKHFDIVCPDYKHAGPRKMYALELVQRVAEILGIDVADLVTMLNTSVIEMLQRGDRVVVNLAAKTFKATPRS